MDRIRNVVVFGDSLSDIGTKWKTFMGQLAIKFKQMTVSPTGRFSDCRNWTDFMYEAATGKTLILGTPEQTVAASKKHKSLTKDAMVPLGSETWFRYANYAEGGACGSTPSGFLKVALNQFKDQTKDFEKDWKALHAKPPAQAGKDDRLTLFFVWFGANDLYTAGCKAGAMAAVAQDVVTKRRNELAALVGNENARFIFCNLAQPLASVRYQEILANAKEGDLAALEAKMENLRKGVQLFNLTVSELTRKSGDIYVDIASTVSPDSMKGLLVEFGLLPGAQVVGTSGKHTSGADADALNAAERSYAHVATSDKAHPTDRVYEIIWKKIHTTIKAKQYVFGKLPA